MLAQQQLCASDITADAAKVAALVHYVIALVPVAYVHANRCSFKFNGA
jgi:hypothetical protein